MKAGFTSIILCNINAEATERQRMAGEVEKNLKGEDLLSVTLA